MKLARPFPINRFLPPLPEDHETPGKTELFIPGKCDEKGLSSGASKSAHMGARRAPRKGLVAQVL